MRAVIIDAHGGPDVLRLTEVDDPTPGPGEALVKVGAVSVNSFLDVSNRAGHVPFARYEFPHILGSEHAGELVGLGPDTESPVAVGDSVFVSNSVPCGTCAACERGDDESCSSLGILGVNMTGAYSDFSVVPVGNLRPLPAGVSTVEASALGVNGPLALRQLDKARATPADTVLVQAASSASGTMAMVVAKTLGHRVLGSVRSATKASKLEELGLADAIVNSTIEGFGDRIRELTDGAGADIVIDNIAAPELWQQSLDALAVGGRIVSSGAKFGGAVELDVRSLYLKSQEIIGVRTSNAEARDRLWDLVAAQGIRPVIDSVYPLDSVADAHRRIEAGENVGRVVLDVQATTAGSVGA